LNVVTAVRRLAKRRRLVWIFSTGTDKEKEIIQFSPKTIHSEKGKEVPYLLSGFSWGSRLWGLFSLRATSHFCQKIIVRVSGGKGSVSSQKGRDVSSAGMY